MPALVSVRVISRIEAEKINCPVCQNFLKHHPNVREIVIGAGNHIWEHKTVRMGAV